MVSLPTAGHLTLSTDLLQLPKGLDEFAMAHELVHLLTPNYGKAFKSFMQVYMPDWEKRSAKLSKYSLKKESASRISSIESAHKN